MKRSRIIGLLMIFMIPVLQVRGQDSLRFQGQVSAWFLYNPDNSLPQYAGIRYIPTLTYQIGLPENRMIDVEFSVNTYGSVGIRFPDSTAHEARFKPYRAWMRFSGEQFELRAGLQKINFGSAVMLRPLMWFDQLDARDPLQLTDGVWGLLGRYYFLNNANLWIWGLYGNRKAKTWETGNTNTHYPELGGRIQLPLSSGEIALSTHFREADTRDLGNGIPAFERVLENRLGLDGKWDLGVGLWFEGAWIRKNKNLGSLTNQEILGAGTDYTFGIGNGLNTVFESLLVGMDEQAFLFEKNIFFSGLSLSYPLGMFDQLGAISYYDWSGHNSYNFFNWKHQMSNFSFYLMAFLNPTQYQLPQLQEGNSLFAGKGIQLMLVYNH
ncbi:MAG: hypothetical protein U0T82_06075 [Bacteroidales bacterium]